MSSHPETVEQARLNLDDVVALVVRERGHLHKYPEAREALIVAVRADCGNKSLAQGERLIEWMNRAEVAEAELAKLKAERTPDDGNAFVFCDYVGERGGCIRGAGHSGCHVHLQRNESLPASPVLTSCAERTPESEQVAVMVEALKALKVARRWIIEDGAEIGWSVDRLAEVIAKLESQLASRPQGSPDASPLSRYLAQHDEDCDANKCAECGLWHPRFRHEPLLVHYCKGDIFTPKPCSCGLDAALSAAPQWSAGENSETVQAKERLRELFGSVLRFEHPANHDGRWARFNDALDALEGSIRFAAPQGSGQATAVCVCGHKEDAHIARGRGSCVAQSDDAQWACQCRGFVLVATAPQEPEK
jgi:hypothetical protein